MFAIFYIEFFIRNIACEVGNSKTTGIGITETPSDIIKYLPAAKNELVGIKGTRVKDDGLILRESLNKGGLVLFLKDNPYEEWSFEFTITDINLLFPEEGGVYLWYTEFDQDQGSFRGGHGKFNGLMAGIEFKGAAPELVYTANDGYDYDGMQEKILFRDSFDPARLKGVKDLTIKIISTKKNFKIELYNGSTLLYDSLKHVDDHPLISYGKDKRFSITSFYNNTSSEKSFKLTKAQLYNRIETEDYDPDAVHAINIGSLPVYENEIAHPNKEVRHVIALFTHFLEYSKGVLGDVGSSFHEKYTEKINKLISKLKDEIKKKRTNNSSPNETKLMELRLTKMEMKLQLIQKTFADLEFFLKTFKEQQRTNTTNLSYLLLGTGLSLFMMVCYNEYKNLKIRNKRYREE